MVQPDGGHAEDAAADSSRVASDQDPAAAPLPDPTSRLGPGPALIEVVICSGFPTQLSLALMLSAVGFDALATDGGLSFTYVVTLTLADATLLCGLIVYFRRAHDESMRDLVFGERSPRTEVALGALLTPLLVLIAAAGLVFIGWLAPTLRNVPDNPMEALLSTPTRAVIFTLVAVVAGGLREELQRAFILRRFEQHLGGGWLGLVLFSVAFGVGHQIQGWDAAIMTGSLGVIWGALYLVRRSIVASMVSHAGFNVAEIVLAVWGANGV